MAAKEKVTFVRSKEFETIDDELSVALEQLENVNQRVVDLLSTESVPVPGAVPETEATAAGNEAEPLNGADALPAPAE